MAGSTGLRRVLEPAGVLPQDTLDGLTITGDQHLFIRLQEQFEAPPPRPRTRLADPAPPANRRATGAGLPC